MCRQAGRWRMQRAVGRMMPACFRQGTYSCKVVRLEFGKCRPALCRQQLWPGSPQAGLSLEPTRALCMGQKRTQCLESHFSTLARHPQELGGGGYDPSTV